MALVRQLAPVGSAARSAAIRQLQQSLGSVLQRHAADAVLAATQARPWQAAAALTPAQAGAAARMADSS